MAAGRALDYCAGVLAEAAAAGAAPVIFGDRWQYLGEMPGLAVGIEFLGRDQIAGLVDVTLLQSVSSPLNENGRGYRPPRSVESPARDSAEIWPVTDTRQTTSLCNSGPDNHYYQGFNFPP
jgi:hypothetical protein